MFVSDPSCTFFFLADALNFEPFCPIPSSTVAFSRTLRRSLSEDAPALSRPPVITTEEAPCISASFSFCFFCGLALLMFMLSCAALSVLTPQRAPTQRELPFWHHPSRMHATYKGGGGEEKGCGSIALRPKPSRTRDACAFKKPEQGDGWVLVARPGRPSSTPPICCFVAICQVFCKQQGGRWRRRHVQSNRVGSVAPDLPAASRLCVAWAWPGR